MNKGLIIMLFMIGILAPGSKAQNIALKSNLLYDVSSTINLGPEVGLAKKWTLELPINYNPWKFDNGMRLRHWGVQPEVRYWFCEKFNRTFIGLHGHYADFNVGGWPDRFFIGENMQKTRYQGHLYGGGISIGHSWILNNRWNIEASVGAGYSHIKYDKYPCTECGSVLKGDSKNYWGPTKASLSLIYIIK